MKNILITTTPTIENRPIREYLGIVNGMAFVRRWWLSNPLSNPVLEYGTEELDNFDWHSYELSLKREPSGPLDYLFATKKSQEAKAAADWAGFKAKLHKAQNLGDSADGKRGRELRDE